MDFDSKFLRIPQQGMHDIRYHDSILTIRPTPTQENTLQVILKISIFRLVNPTVTQQYHADFNKLYIFRKYINSPSIWINETSDLM